MAKGETIYPFTVKDRQGKSHEMSEFAGKVLLIVNTASECGFTPQLEGLQKLHDSYSEQGFTVIGFPCNQFGGQEPLEGEAIGEFCQVNYGVTFPVFDKVDVHGDEVHPLYAFLADKSRNGAVSARPRWNFHKYLIGRDGKVVDYYLPITKPEARRLAKAIETELSAAVPA